MSARPVAQYKNENTRRSAEYNKLHKGRRLELHRLRKYGLTSRDYEVLLESQNGLCKLCEKPKPLVVDHDHYTGRVRGLLCQRCNLNLSFVEHPGSLEKITRYLGRWS